MAVLDNVLQYGVLASVLLTSAFILLRQHLNGDLLERDVPASHRALRPRRSALTISARRPIRRRHAVEHPRMVVRARPAARRAVRAHPL
jgi:hypothetical protein